MAMPRIVPCRPAHRFGTLHRTHTTQKASHSRHALTCSSKQRRNAHNNARVCAKREIACLRSSGAARCPSSSSSHNRVAGFWRTPTPSHGDACHDHQAIGSARRLLDALGHQHVCRSNYFTSYHPSNLHHHPRFPVRPTTSRRPIRPHRQHRLSTQRNNYTNKHPPRHPIRRPPRP